MSTVITISSNKLRLMSKIFLVIVPLKLDRKGEVAEGGKYTCEVDGYGDVGQVECYKMHECHVYELSEAAIMLAEANPNYRKLLEEQGYMKLNKVQVCYFHFLRRRSEPFINMWEQEAKTIGVDIVTQPQLF